MIVSGYPRVMQSEPCPIPARDCGALEAPSDDQLVGSINRLFFHRRSPPNHPSAGRFSPLRGPSGQPPPKPRRLASQPRGYSLRGPAQSNRPVWGGARHGGRRETSGEAPFASRWVRIFSITTESSMQAMILTAPPQAGQVSIRCRTLVSSAAPRSLIPGARRSSYPGARVWSAIRSTNGVCSWNALTA